MFLKEFFDKSKIILWFFATVLFIRYFVRTPPFLEINAIFFILIGILLFYMVAISYLYRKEILTLAQKPKRFAKRYPFVLWFLLLYGILPTVVGMTEGHPFPSMAYELGFFLSFSLFIPLLVFFREERLVKNLTILLIGILILFSMDFFREWLLTFYRESKTHTLYADGKWQTDWVLFWLKKLKKDHHFMFFAPYLLIALWSASYLDRRLRYLFIPLFGIHLLFYSRNQIIPLTLSILFILLIQRKNHRFWIPLYGLGVLSTTAIALYSPLARLDYTQRKATTLAIRYHEREMLLKSLDGKILTGKGLGASFPYVGYNFSIDPHRRLYKSHNSFLNYIYKGGLPLFLLFLIFYLKTALVTIPRCREYDKSVLPIFLLSFSTYHLIRGGLDSVYYGYEGILMLVIHLALYYAIEQSPDEVERKSYRPEEG